MMLQNTANPILHRRRITLVLTVLGLGMIAVAFIVNSPEEILLGEFSILTSLSILITDYIAYANLGAAFFNARLVMMMGFGLAWLINARFNGCLLSAIFALAGFAFFGKNAFSVPPILRVFFYSIFFSAIKG